MVKNQMERKAEEDGDLAGFEILRGKEIGAGTEEAKTWAR